MMTVTGKQPGMVRTGQFCRNSSSVNSASTGRDMYKVTVAIVTFRSQAELPECLESILASDIPVKVVIIDNDSKDGTLELAQAYAEKHSNVIAFSSGGNIGLAAANNLVMPHVESEYVLMLNPDTVARRNTISRMLAIMEADPEIGVVGPKNVYGDGQCFSSYQRTWNLWHVFAWRVVPYSLTRTFYDRCSRYNESEVFYVSGSCLLIRAKLFQEINGYDPAFFLTIEDVCDLCRRVRDRGYRVIFTPRTEIVHHCSRSGDQVPVLAILSGYKGSIYYFKKYNGWVGGVSAYLIVTFGCAVKIVISLLKVLMFRRNRDQQTLKVYCQILPQLLRRGPSIAHTG